MAQGLLLGLCEPAAPCRVEGGTPSLQEGESALCCVHRIFLSEALVQPFTLEGGTPKGRCYSPEPNHEEPTQRKGWIPKVMGGRGAEKHVRAHKA